MFVKTPKFFTLHEENIKAHHSVGTNHINTWHVWMFWSEIYYDVTSMVHAKSLCFGDTVRWCLFFVPGVLCRRDSIS